MDHRGASSGMSIARLTGIEIGEPRRGKVQPRLDEARKLYAELFRAARTGESRAGCLIVQMLQGTRSREVWGLRARDLDTDGTRLHVADDGGKAANATRTREIDVPALRERLRHFSQGKQPGDYPVERSCAVHR